MKLPVSQLTPAYPALQVQVYELISTTQVPPFRHGLEVHASMPA